MSKSFTLVTLLSILLPATLPAGAICKGFGPQTPRDIDARHGENPRGFHQPKAIPSDTGAPVEFHGSTTGPKYDEQTCSPLQVTWSVRPHCARIDLSSLSAWCAGNVFGEDHAHGVRELVTDSRLLSTIR